ncbi:MAG: hypothetical protein ACRD1Y_05890 [Terriglobales bacterium]
MKSIVVVLIVLLGTVGLAAAFQTPGWVGTPHVDPLHRINDEVWVLKGKYAIAPHSKTTRTGPEIVAECKPGWTRSTYGWGRGWAKGTFVTA